MRIMTQTVDTPNHATMANHIDLNSVPLRDLWNRKDTALDEAIRKVIAGAENESAKSVSAFNSAI